MKIRCIDDGQYVSIIKNKVYEATRINSDFFGIIDETGEEYGFPARLFEVVADEAESAQDLLLKAN